LTQNNFEVNEVKMKKYDFSILMLAVLLMTIFSFSAVKAQEELPNDDGQKQNFNQARRPSLLAELNLSTEQIRQIRRINRENQPLLREAQKRLREARINLDRAIYADNLDEAEVRARLKAVNLDQAEVIKLRSTTEFAVRKVLTPEQLVRFREVRRRYMERMEILPEQRRNRSLNAPAQKLINRQRRLRNNN